MTTTEIMILIAAFPFLVVLGFVLVPIIFGAVLVVGGIIWFVVSIALLPFAWCICKYNEWRDQKQVQREWDELEQWKKDNPESYQWARDNPGK